MSSRDTGTDVFSRYSSLSRARDGASFLRPVVEGAPKSVTGRMDEPPDRPGA